MHRLHGRLRAIWEWAKDRFALQRIWQHVLDRRVAKGAWYFGDGATLFLLFMVLLVTGAAMTVDYSAAPEAAYRSVQRIDHHGTFGWFVRGLHYWSAGLMVVMLFFHLFRQIMVGGYKSPREGTWLIGVGLFFLVITMSLLGYVLRWDQRGIYGLRVALNIFYRVPAIGEELVVFVQGGRHISATTLSRIFAAHVIFGPLLITGLIAYHLYLVVVHSVTSPTERKKRHIADAAEQRAVYAYDARSASRGEVFFPETAAKSGLMAALVLGVGWVLASCWGGGLLYPAAQLHTSSFPVEEWWWSWFSSLAALLPPHWTTFVYVGMPLGAFVLLVALPFIDRTPYRGILHRPFFTSCVAICVFGLVGLSSLRLQSPWTAWPDPEPPPVPTGLQLTPAADSGRKLFAHYGCNSCHAIDRHGRQVGPDLARLPHMRSYAYLREYILAPPTDVAMPAYADRLTEQELHQLASFVLVVQTVRRR